jgi:hypothetical protein
LTTDVGDVVLVVGVVVVLFVIVGVVFTLGVVVDVSDVVGAVDVFGVDVVVRDVLGVKEVLGVEVVFDVMEDAPLSAIDGLLLTPRITLSNGARSSPLASGSFLLDVRFFRIAMFYPVFFNIDVKPAMFVTGLSFAVLANVFGGATEVAF